jgi:Glycosyl transferases group 1
MNTIIVSTPGFPWENNPYGAQGYYVIKMFFELGFHVIYVPFIYDKYKDSLKKFKDVIISEEELNDGNHINSIQNNLTLYSNKKMTWGFLKRYEEISGGKTVFVSAFNDLINKSHSQYIFFLGDLSNFIMDDVFTCKSIFWFPNHFEPLNKDNEKKLFIFDKILALNPSSIPIIGKNIKSDVTFVPHIIDDSYYNKIKSSLLSKSDLKKKYNISPNYKVISIIAGNYDKSIRKGFDVAFIAFKELLKKHDDIFLYVQSFSYVFDNFNNDLRHIIDYLEIPRSKYQLNTSKVSINEIEEIYAFTDIFLMASRTEGFGLPLLEAQLRGIPVVSNKFSAMQDFTFFGETCEPAQITYCGYSEGYMSVPSSENLCNGLSTVLDNLDNEKYMQKRDKAISIIKNDMSYEVVKEKLTKEVIETNSENTYHFCILTDSKQRFSLDKSFCVVRKDDFARVNNIKYNFLIVLNDDLPMDCQQINNLHVVNLMQCVIFRPKYIEDYKELSTNPSQFIKNNKINYIVSKKTVMLEDNYDDFEFGFREILLANRDKINVLHSK